VLEPTVCFGSVNVELYPDLAYGDFGEDHLPIQAIFTNGQMKKLNFGSTKGEIHRDISGRFARETQAITGTYMHEISCQ
jgi:hypothetical protein